MSGWIKKEKDLRDDPRVQRMAIEMSKRFKHITDSNGVPLLGVTLCRSIVLGGLDQIWMLGDSFADVDDTLGMTMEELDAVIGLPGFCSLMPPDWMTQDLAGTVKLTDFGTKNSPEAKAAALAAARQAKHRAKGGASRTSNGDALPDRQTRQDIPSEEDARARAALSRLPSTFALTAEREAIAVEHQIDPVRTFKKFCMHWKQAKGPRAMKRDWDEAWRRWCEHEIPEKPSTKPALTPEEAAKAAADYERRKELSRAQPIAPVGPPAPPGVGRR